MNAPEGDAQAQGAGPEQEKQWSAHVQPPAACEAWQAAMAVLKHCALSLPLRPAFPTASAHGR